MNEQLSLEQTQAQKRITGVIIASAIIILWLGHLAYILSSVEPDPANPVFWLHFLLQTYLYTGLFITGHDAMHGTIYRGKGWNSFFGSVSCFLYAGLSYKTLIKNHFLHHKHPGEEGDPDFSVKTQNFWLWWLSFMYHYTTLWQLTIMAVAFNVMKRYIPESSLIAFWVIPAFLSSLQLFYFGTYKPHMKPHTDEMKPHNARSQKLNHLWAMLSCYFFGYHHEHHEYPRTPWWQLYKVKEAAEGKAA